VFFLPCACRFALVGFLSSLLASGLKASHFSLAHAKGPSRFPQNYHPANRRRWKDLLVEDLVPCKRGQRTATRAEADE